MSLFIYQPRRKRKRSGDSDDEGSGSESDSDSDSDSNSYCSDKSPKDKDLEDKDDDEEEGEGLIGCAWVLVMNCSNGLPDSWSVSVMCCIHMTWYYYLLIHPFTLYFKIMLNYSRLRFSSV